MHAAMSLTAAEEAYLDGYFSYQRRPTPQPTLPAAATPVKVKTAAAPKSMLCWRSKPRPVKMTAAEQQVIEKAISLG